MQPTHREQIKTFFQATRSHLPVVPQLAVLAMLLLVIFSGAIGTFVFSSDTPTNTPVTNTTTPLPPAPPAPEQQLAIDGSTFSDISLRAEAVFVWDVKNQRVLFERNSDTVLPLASITKLMTTLLANELLTADTEISISETAVQQDGGTFLHAQDIFTHAAVRTMSLMASTNDGAYALAAAAGEALVPNDGANAFVHAMNIRAQELDLHNTTFKNPTGLDISPTEAGSYSTAKEASFLMEYMLLKYPELLQTTTQSDTRIYTKEGTYYDIENTNHYLHQIPNVLGSKTGYTDLAGGNLTVAFNAGLDRPIIITVLNSTWSERFTDVLALVAATQTAITTH